MDAGQAGGRNAGGAAGARGSREATLPDQDRLARYRASPELGPRALFFSGGSALRELSSVLTEYTHNSIHLITPFDSGGSSAVLRRAFGMPAVGDIRNRIMALADRSARGNPEIAELFAFRLPKDASQKALRETLNAMLRGEHPLMLQAPEPLRALARANLRFFCERMPGDFDLRGASVGNLILTGGYFNNERNLEAVIFLFSKLVEARGVALPIVDADLHLASRLADGQTVLGQRRLTGKESAGIASPVQETWLIRNEDDPAPVSARISEHVAGMIREADLVCYPVGSFYSSLTANLLPDGVAAALAENRAPKLYLPNLGNDPEEYGMTLADKIRTLCGYLSRGLQADAGEGRGRTGEAGPAAGAGKGLLDFVLLDAGNPGYGTPDELAQAGREAARFGAALIETPLTAPKQRDRLDPRLTVETLLSFV